MNNVGKQIQFKSYRGAKSSSREEVLALATEAQRVALVQVFSALDRGECLEEAAWNKILEPVGLRGTMAVLARRGLAVEFTPSHGLEGGVHYSAFELVAPTVRSMF